MKYLQYVNSKQGTQSVPRYSNGNTTALTQLPFGMNGFTFQTSSDRGNWFYHPQDRSLEGIRLTHQPSPWIGDYGTLIFQPQCGEAMVAPDARWSGYRPEDAVIRPDYMKADLLRYRALFELTPTERGAIMRITYRDTLQPRFAILPLEGSSGYQVDFEKRMVTGFVRNHAYPVADNFALYFALQFDCELDAAQTIGTSPNGTNPSAPQGEGEQVGVNVALTDRLVEIRMAVSYISVEQAVCNLKRELLGHTFEELRGNAEEIWESYLSRIEIDTEDMEQKKTFYSCLHRMFLFPRKFYEMDEDGKPFHYCPHDGSIAPGRMYTDNGFWDTFRTVYPLYSLIAPKEYQEIVEGFVNIYRDSGWLPKWPCPGEAGMMPGTLFDAVIADAAAKGIVDGALLEKAFEGMLKQAEVEADDPRYGRHGTSSYQRYGYIPRDQFKESVNHTLDYVYSDFCIAQTAEVLGKHEIAARYRKRTGNYRFLFDPKTGFMRGRDTAGNQAESFDPLGWGGEYCEGGPWQNSFAVYHDIEGLAALYGGKDAFFAMLDELFATKPEYHVGGYLLEIHEMTEMAAVSFGQCALSNQPSFHIPYLYAALGDTEKTEALVEQMAKELFSAADDGFPGDEDNGSMSGWYVFSTLGLYPLCPGKGEYVQIKPLVKRAVLHTEKGEVVIASGKKNSPIITHEQLLKKDG